MMLVPCPMERGGEMSTFGERLRELREKAGLSQTQLATASELPVGSIRNYEQGIREPHWIAVFKLAGGLQVSADAFADCTSSTKQPPPARRRGVKPKRPRERKGG
jgi:transcriptional regulator with XRE-family HTH domain